MINFIPIFPLNIVVYPNEPLNLHIFEDRYKQLINDCIAEKKPFGIPCVLEKKIEEYGTLMEIHEIAKTYEDGSMDIRTRGLKVFRMLEVVKDVPEKEYYGGIVDYPSNIIAPDESDISILIQNEVKRLYTLMNLEEKFPERQKMLSYEIAHYIGLTLQEELELLMLFTETQRLEYIRRHLKKLVPVIQELEQIKERIKMNGHFRDLSLGDLNL